MQLKVYGQCVASKVPAIEQGMCAAEFNALNKCMIEVVSSEIVLFSVFILCSGSLLC